MIDPEAVLVKSARDGGFIIEDEDTFQELFRLDPNVELADLIRQVIEISNKRQRIGRGEGARQVKDDFRRLMGLARY